MLNVKKWKDDDYERWNEGDFWQSFRKRNCATCIVHYGGYGHTPNNAPIGICYGHGLLHTGHHFGREGGMYDMRYYDVCLCFCDDNLVQEEEKSITNEWPDPNAKEVTVVNHLNSLRDGLTEDTATKLSKNGSCPFWNFASYNARGYENAFRSYLTLLLGIARLVPRSTFLGNFPKSCGGCAIAQFFCIVAMHPALHSEVDDLLRELLCDKNDKILEMLPDSNEMVRMVRKAYNRTDYPFPYIGVCLDFDHKTEAYKVIKALGSMIESDGFIQLMSNDTEKAISIAQKMITNLKDPFRSDIELSRLLNDM
ncbi:unnamed protein product [Adineta steineri]|uniref:Uncharacterized protein n=3 Tax=Adineta steineri TaxID=433720 RepID=A0A815U895_9BILA|nr:unnamed protein product [Adineta steineri]